MPRTNSRKRNNHRNDITARVSVASNLSPNAPEFIPIMNDESTTVNQREHLPVTPITLNESLNASNSSGNNCNSNSSEAMNPVIANALASRGQRDLLIGLLNECKVDCVICYERAKNVEPIWSCRDCFQIMHLKCIMVWFIKSHTNSTWRCPACQSNIVGKPNYVCFCGALPNPFANNVDTPHSCGQVCGQRKKNSNSEFDDCHHKCTLLCHPGPCPQCVVQVLRKCGCGKTQLYVQCGQSTPILCQSICSKILNCKNHVCEKQCHAGKCEPCKKPNTQCLQIVEPERSPQYSNFVHNFTAQDYVTAEELRMLGLDPIDLFPRGENVDIFYLNGYNGILSDDDVYDEDFNLEIDEEMDDDDNDDDDDLLFEDIYDARWLHENDAIIHQYRIRDSDFNSRIFTNNTEDSSTTSTSNSSNNTNISSNNTNSSNNNSRNNTSNSNSDDDDGDDDYFEDNDYDELPLDLSGSDPNQFNTDEGSSYEDDSEEEARNSIFEQLSQEIRNDPDFGEDSSFSEDSTDNSQSSDSYVDDSSSSSTDTTSSDTSSSS